MESRTFAQILREKTSPSPSEKSVFPSIERTEPAHLAYLMGSIPTFEFGPRRQYQAPPPAPRKPHELNPSQVLALAWFESHGEKLDLGFNSKELKTAFRRLALRLHPDVNTQQGPLFIELMSHHQTLAKVFRTTNLK